MGRLLCKLMMLFLLAPVFGCERNTSSKGPPEIKTSVTFLHYFTDSISGGFSDIASSYNSRNSLYNLKSIPLDHEAFKSSIRQTLESGNPPDLYSYWAGARTASVIAQLEPVDDIWQQYNLDKRFSPAITKAASEYNGKKYLIPMTQHYVGFFYNTKVFAAHSIKPPKTWSEFISVCERLKTAGVTPIALGAKEKWPAQFWFDMLLLRTAPFEFRQKLMQGEVSYQDARVTAAFEKWAYLLQKGYFSPRPNDISWDSGAAEDMYSGKAAMTLMGTWIIGYLNNPPHKWVAGKDYDFFPFPVIDPAVPVASLGPIDGLILPRKAANKEGAKNVMVFLTEEEPQKAISRGAGSLAPSSAVPSGFYSGIQQRIMQEIAQSPNFAFNYDLATPPAIADLGLNAFSELVEFPGEYRKIQSKLAADAAVQFSRIKAAGK